MERRRALMGYRPSDVWFEVYREGGEFYCRICAGTPEMVARFELDHEETFPHGE